MSVCDTDKRKEGGGKKKWGKVIGTDGGVRIREEDGVIRNDVILFG